RQRCSSRWRGYTPCCRAPTRPNGPRRCACWRRPWPTASTDSTCSPATPTSTRSAASRDSANWSPPPAAWPPPPRRSGVPDLIAILLLRCRWRPILVTLEYVITHPITHGPILGNENFGGSGAQKRLIAHNSQFLPDDVPNTPVDATAARHLEMRRWPAHVSNVSTWRPETSRQRSAPPGPTAST